MNFSFYSQLSSLLTCVFLVFLCTSARTDESLDTSFKTVDRLVQQGRFLEAEPLLKDAIGGSRLSHRIDNLQIQIYLNALADIHIYERNFFEAEADLNQATYEESEGSAFQYHNIISTLSNFSKIYMMTNRIYKVEDTIERASHIAQEKFGRDSPEAAIPLTILIQFYSGGSLSGCKAARSVFEDTTRIMAKLKDSERFIHGKILTAIVFHYYNCRFMYRNASTLMLTTLIEASKYLPKIHPSYIICLSLMGKIEYEERDFDSAENYFLIAESAGERSMGLYWYLLASIRDDLRRVYFDRHAIYLSQGRVADAAVFQKKLEALYRRRPQ